jgi:hypothetical protein
MSKFRAFLTESGFLGNTALKLNTVSASVTDDTPSENVNATSAILDGDAKKQANGVGAASTNGEG